MKIHQLTYKPYKEGKLWTSEIFFDCELDYTTNENIVNVVFEYSTYKGNFSYSTSFNHFDQPLKKEILIYLMQYDQYFVEGIIFGIQYVMFQYSKSPNPPIILDIKITNYAIRTISLNESNAFCMIKGLYRALNFYPPIQPEIKNILKEPEEHYVYIFPNVPYPPPIGIHTALTYEISYKTSNLHDIDYLNSRQKEYYRHQQEFYAGYCPTKVEVEIPIKSPARELIEKNLETKDICLDLGFCGLFGTEHELDLLDECIHLETLILSNYWNEFDHKDKKWVTKRSNNHSNENKLKQIPAKLPKNISKLILGDSLFVDWEIQNLSILNEQNNLIYLDLTESYIREYSFLKDLKNLQILNLSENQIEDVSFLKDLKNLQGLVLNSNRIIDASPLKGLTNLKNLCLNMNRIKDMSFLKYLKNLQNLDLRLNNPTLEDSFLEDLTNQQNFDLSGYMIVGLSFLKDLVNLQSLDLSENNIEDISFLKDLVNLQNLDLSGNKIEDISFLKNLVNLQSLDLSWNNIEDISFLKNLVNLQSLDLSGNEIEDISFLKNLVNLQSLDLSGNEIEDISFLKNLVNLQSLDLSGNNIKEISLEIFICFQKMKELILDGNPIQNIPTEIFSGYNNVYQGVISYLVNVVNRNI